MDKESAARLLDTQIDHARRVLAMGFGVNWTESTFFDVIHLLRQEPLLKDHFLKAVAGTLDSPAPGSLCPGCVPPELIELVTHELRWNELLQLADQRIAKYFHGDRGLAVSDVAEHIHAAYSDQWADREFYRHYATHNHWHAP